LERDNKLNNAHLAETRLMLWHFRIKQKTQLIQMAYILTLFVQGGGHI